MELEKIIYQGTKIKILVNTALHDGSLDEKLVSDLDVRMRDYVSKNINPLEAINVCYQMGLSYKKLFSVDPKIAYVVSSISWFSKSVSYVRINVDNERSREFSLKELSRVFETLYLARDFVGSAYSDQKIRIPPKLKDYFIDCVYLNFRITNDLYELVDDIVGAMSEPEKKASEDLIKKIHFHRRRDETQLIEFNKNPEFYLIANY